MLTYDQAITLVGLLTDTVDSQRAVIVAQAAAITSLEERLEAATATTDPAGVTP